MYPMQLHSLYRWSSVSIDLLFHLRLPASLSDQERQLLEQLRQARSADPREGWLASARL
jgi:curved DNA-binding protein